MPKKKSKSLPANPSLLQRLKVVWQGDWTRLGVKLQAANVAVLGCLASLNSYVSDPTFKDYLQQLEVPKSVLVFCVVIGLLSFISLKSKDA